MWIPLAGGLRIAAPLNIILILADDHRADHLGCAGHPIVRTPHLDQLAANGVRFDQAVCTSPLCMPSRVCYQLGQWERKHGINFGSGNAVSPEAWRLSYPMLLQDAGYHVGYVGKSHSPVGVGGGRSGLLESSFDYWYGNHGHSSFYPKEQHESYPNAASDTQAEIFAEGAANFLEPCDAFTSMMPVTPRPRKPGQPFCLALNFNLPHRNGTISMQQRQTDDELYRSAYRDRINDFALPGTYIAYDDIVEPRLPKHVYSRRQIATYDYVKTEAAWREHAVRYCQTITGIDRVVGELIATLQRMGELERTLIVYSSDHGIMQGEHGLGGKSLPYEPSMRIPMIVYDPRLPAALRGKVRSEQVVPQDVTSTILAAADVAQPATMQGRDMVPLMRGDANDWREAVFCENSMTIQDYPRTEAVRSREWKYIRYFPRHVDPASDKPWQNHGEDFNATIDLSLQGEQPIFEELFRLADDPDERHNLADDANHASTLSAMRKQCDALLREARGDATTPRAVVSA